MNEFTVKEKIKELEELYEYIVDPEHRAILVREAFTEWLQEVGEDYG